MEHFEYLRKFFESFEYFMRIFENFLIILDKLWVFVFVLTIFCEFLTFLMSLKILRVDDRFLNISKHFLICPINFIWETDAIYVSIFYFQFIRNVFCLLPHSELLYFISSLPYIFIIYSNILRNARKATLPQFPWMVCYWILTTMVNCNLRPWARNFD